MWENIKQNHCVDKRSPWLGEERGLVLSLIAQTSCHMFFFLNVDKCYQIKTQMEGTAAWFVKVNPYNSVRKMGVHKISALYILYWIFKNIVLTQWRSSEDQFEVMVTLPVAH